MKTKLIIGMIVAGAAIGTSAVVAAREATVEKKGSVSQFLMNPEGDADGFLLGDGTQVHFPPHLSNQLRKLVHVHDDVTVKGVAERASTFRAETITNTKTGESLVDTPPSLGHAPPPPPPAPGEPAGEPPHPGPDLAGPGPAHGHGPGRHEGLARLSVEGKITHQLFGPRGDVNGVILADGTIVHVGPKALDDAKASLEVGKKLRASGFGTKNDLGESIEATDIQNF